MATPEPVPPSDELRRILTSLADGLLPLAKWVGEPTKYKPAQSDLPWRQGDSLSAERMGVAEFFEKLLRETSDEEKLLARWAEINRNGPPFTPFKQVETWRKARGLEAAMRFGIVQSGNVAVDGEGKPVARASFYTKCWPLVIQAVRARNPVGPDAWEAFAKELFVDQCPQWPATAPVKSSTFATQLARDVLYAMLGMRPPASDPWEFALLIELGEHRRVNNAYTPEDVRKTVYTLRALIDNYATKGGA